jgi:Zn-dependent M28 family amino/carboxypeptidase
MRFAILAALAACGTPEALPIDATSDDALPGCTKPSLDDSGPLLNEWITQLPAPRSTIQQRTDARDYLQAELTQLGLTPSLHQYNNGANVIATLPATMGSEKAIIVGAHFDTVANTPGANDNASGVVVVLGVARLLAATPCRTAPVTFAFFDQEELGLFGARAYAQTLNAADIRAVQTIDQVAWDMDGDRRFELEAPTTTLEAEWTAAAAVIGVPVTRVSTEGTDHEAFRERGFAAMGLTEEFVGGDTSDFRHEPGDTVATVDMTYLGLALQLTAQVVITQVSP